MSAIVSHSPDGAVRILPERWTRKFGSLTTTAMDLHPLLSSGKTISVELCEAYLDQIRKAILAVVPTTFSRAADPSATTPLSYPDYNGRLFELAAFANAHYEDILLKYLSAWEITFPARRQPSLLPLNYLCWK